MLFKSHNKVLLNEVHSAYPLSYILMAIVVLSCHFDPNSQDNKRSNIPTSLQRVLDHYDSAEDSLKKKAADFLLVNMINKSFVEYSPQHLNLIDFADSCRSLQMTLQEDDTIISNYWNSLKNSNFIYSYPIRDIHYMDSTLLVGNIDLAFEAWDAAPWKEDYTFEDFCEYVLPYRNEFDIPSNWREEFRNRYSDILLSNSSADVISIAGELNQILKSFTWQEIFYDFPNMRTLDIERIGMGVCKQHSSIKIAALRSIGIPVSQNFALYGTSWVSILDKDGKFVDYGASYAPKRGVHYADYRKNEHFAKIFSYRYAIRDNLLLQTRPQDEIPPLFRNKSLHDVTAFHIRCADVTLDLQDKLPEDVEFVYLLVFEDGSKEWKEAAWAHVTNKKLNFKDMGLARIYLPAYYLEGQFVPLTHPIYLDTSGLVTHLIPDLNKLEEITIHRKYSMGHAEFGYSNLFVGAIFQGSNNADFNGAIALGGIDSPPEYEVTINFKTDEKVRYVRLKSDSALHISTLEFFDEKNTRIEGHPLCGGRITTDPRFAFDGNIRTNFHCEGSGWIGLDFRKPIKVEGVRFLFRNSFNTIEPGDLYEVFYWCGQWKSLGKMVAQRNYLKVLAPTNSLLLLKNHSKGKQEKVFIIREGKQIWG